MRNLAIFLLIWAVGVVVLVLGRFLFGITPSLGEIVLVTLMASAQAGVMWGFKRDD